MNPNLKSSLIWANLIGLLVLAVAGWTFYANQRALEQARQEAIKNDKPWLSYKNLPFEPQTTAVRAGHIIPLRVVRCNSDEIKHVYSIGRWLINDDDSTQPAIILDGGAAIPILPGCTDEISEANLISLTTPAGFHYHLEGIAEIHTQHNNFTVIWSSKSFLVMPPL